MRSFYLIFFMLYTAGCQTLSLYKHFPESRDKRMISADIHRQLGLRYLAQGDNVRAHQKLLFALQQAPLSAEAQQAMGYFFLKEGRPNVAKSYYEQAIRIAPHQGEIQNNYGVFLCTQGKYREALQYFEGALKDVHYVHDALVHKNAARCALKIPNPRLAQYYFKRAAQKS